MTNDAAEGVAGNIVGIAGFEELDIGETPASSEDSETLPFVEIRSSHCDDVLFGK